MFHMLNVIILIFSFHSRKAKIITFIKNFTFSFVFSNLPFLFGFCVRKKKNMIEAMVVPRNSNGIKREDKEVKEPKREP